MMHVPKYKPEVLIVLTGFLTSLATLKAALIVSNLLLSNENNGSPLFQPVYAKMTCKLLWVEIHSAPEPDRAR